MSPRAPLLSEPFPCGVSPAGLLDVDDLSDAGVLDSRGGERPASARATPGDAVVPAEAPPTTVSAALVAALRELGVTQAYGVMGGAIAPFFRALVQSSLRVYHLRHEAGAAFAAIEASLVTRRPVVVFTTAGPGLTNALTGMVAAQFDGAQVIFISAASAAAHRGRVATQESSVATLGGAGLLLPGGALDLAFTLEHPAQLAPIAARLAAALRRPGSMVAHLSLPIDVQRLPCERDGRAHAPSRHAPGPCPEALAEHAALLQCAPPVIWLGFGARHAAAPIRRLVERLDARVMCSPRAKGVFPEEDPRFLGVTGLGGHARVDELLLADRPAYTLVLGTRMGESTSFWAPELTPGCAFLHVDTQASAFGAAYPECETIGVVSDVGRYVEALLLVLGPKPSAPSARLARPGQLPASPRLEGPVRPQQLMAALQREVVEGSDAWLMAESGNSFCWTTHHLRFSEPGRYRVSTGFGSMGHATCGVVGAALARRGKAFAVVGDGAMMMLNELHSAVQYRADAVWVVLNDATYLMCAQGMRMMGWEPFSCDLPRVDFVALARAIGADGERVDHEGQLDGALRRALAARGPWVLEITIDPAEVPPSGRRNRSLMQQGAQTAATA